MPSLSLEILRVITGTPTVLIRSDKAGIKSIKLRQLEIPTDRNGQFWIHFARHDPSIYVPAADVLDGSVAINATTRQRADCNMSVLPS